MTSSSLLGFSPPPRAGGGAGDDAAAVLFERVIATTPPQTVAHRLGLHPNTVQRWLERRAVPAHYAGDFKRMLGGSGDAEDQFYTKKEVARHCYRAFLAVAKRLRVNTAKYHFIEPSAGCGYFYQTLPAARRIGVDLSPRCAGVRRADYLRWTPKKKHGYIVIGNPPFGLRGHLALQFINHSAAFADMTAFILPQLFDSDGKGAPGKRVDKRYRLAHSERLPPDSFVKPDGAPVSISTTFQVWTKINHGDIRLPPRKTCRAFMRVYSLSNGGTPASTRNKDMIGKCDVYLPSTCFAGMKAYRSFDELPNRRGYGVVIHRDKRRIKALLSKNDWTRAAFKSTNGAYNLRCGLIAGVVTARGFCDETPPARMV